MTTAFGDGEYSINREPSPIPTWAVGPAVGLW